ncbi:MAG: hypothetical protein Ta2D_12570 [Rickettsiales bacterium]|nr:MAG: hypothetical protein Ta2D_12570 [Rickettsiales bacterium]
MKKRIIFACVGFLIFIGIGFCFYNYIVGLTLTNENIEIKEEFVNNYSKKTLISQILKEQKMIFNKNKIQNFILENYYYFLQQINFENSIINYADTYNESFRVLKQLKKMAKLSNRDYLEMKKYLSKTKFRELSIKLEHLTLKNNSNDIIGVKYYLSGLVNELNLNNNAEASIFYEYAIKANPYEPSYYIKYADFLYSKYRIDNAISNYELALYKGTWPKTKRAEQIKLKLLSKISKILILKGEYELALQYLNALLIDAINFNNSSYVFDSTYNIGLLNLKLSNYKNAIDSFDYAYKIAVKKLGDEEKLKVFIQLSKANKKYGDYESAKFYALKGIDLAKKLNKLPEIATTSALACVDYKFLEKTDLMSSYCSRALYLNEILTNITGRPEYIIQNMQILNIIGDENSKKDYYYQNAFKIINDNNLEIQKLYLFDIAGYFDVYLEQRNLLNFKDTISCDVCRIADIKMNAGQNSEAINILKSANAKNREQKGKFALLIAEYEFNRGNYEEANKWTKIAKNELEKVFTNEHIFLKRVKMLKF